MYSHPAVSWLPHGEIVSWSSTSARLQGLQFVVTVAVHREFCDNNDVAGEAAASTTSSHRRVVEAGAEAQAQAISACLKSWWTTSLSRGTDSEPSRAHQTTQHHHQPSSWTERRVRICPEYILGLGHKTVLCEYYIPLPSVAPVLRPSSYTIYRHLMVLGVGGCPCESFSLIPRADQE